jgi:predicted metalloprotease
MGSDKHFQIIYLGSNGLPYLTWQDQKGTWYPREDPLPADKSFIDITAAVGADGHLQVVLVADDELPYLIWQDQGGTWNYRNDPLPTPNNKKIFAPTIGMGADGNLQVVFLGTDDYAPYLIFQDRGGTWYLRKDPLPTDPSNKKYFRTATAAMGADGHLQVILVADDGLPYLIFQDRGGAWNYRNDPLPTYPNNKKYNPTLTAAMSADGHLQVIYVATNDGLPYLTWQDQKGTWYPREDPLPTDPNNKKYFRTATAAMGADGHLQVIFVADDGLPYLIFQDRGGAWNYRNDPLPTPNNKKFITAPAVAMGADGNLQVIFYADDRYLYLIYQDKGGSWYARNDSISKV